MLYTAETHAPQCYDMCGLDVLWYACAHKILAPSSWQKAAPVLSWQLDRSVMLQYVYNCRKQLVFSLLLAILYLMVDGGSMYVNICIY